MRTKILAVCLFGLAGCGNGPGWLGAGLVIEDLLDPDEGAVDGLAGLACYDLNANGECDDEEDTNDDGLCDALDCRGEEGSQGDQGDRGLPGRQGVPGATGPVGPPGVPPPPVVIVVLPDLVHPELENDDPPGGSPPHGNAWGPEGPHGNQEKP